HAADGRVAQRHQRALEALGSRHAYARLHAHERPPRGVRMVRVAGDEQNVELHRIPPLLGSAAPRARWRGEHVGRAAGESMRAPRPSAGWLWALYERPAWRRRTGR